MQYNRYLLNILEKFGRGLRLRERRHAHHCFVKVYLGPFSLLFDNHQNAGLNLYSALHMLLEERQGIVLVQDDVLVDV